MTEQGLVMTEQGLVYRERIAALFGELREELSAHKHALEIIESLEKTVSEMMAVAEVYRYERVDENDCSTWETCAVYALQRQFPAGSPMDELAQSLMLRVMTLQNEIALFRDEALERLS